MVGVASDLVFLVYETLVQSGNNSMILFTNILVIYFVYWFKNIMKTIGLPFIGTEQIISIAIKMIVAQIVQQ